MSPLLTLLTAAPYADCLVRLLGEAADQERAALYQARLADAVPIPVIVTRYRCPHCPTRRSKKAAAAHIARCWHNPAVRACESCRHHEPVVPSGGCWGDPYCNCPDTPESCAVGAAIPMVTDCPQWQPVA